VLTLRLPSQPNQRRKSPQLTKTANRLGVRQSAWALVATIYRVLIGASVSGQIHQSLTRPSIPLPAAPRFRLSDGVLGIDAPLVE
jgi:hypothetical protein